LHFTIGNFTKQAFALVGADGDEIAACGGVVVSLKSDGATMVFFWIVFHIGGS
jgi:hypothetical protein